MLALTIALLATANVHACTLHALAPFDGASTTTPPLHLWEGDCHQHRIQYSPTGLFGADTYETPWVARDHYRLDGSRWAPLAASDLFHGSWWRIQGRDTSGIVNSTPRFLHVEQDADGDGYGYADGDCDDLDATVYPGARELCDGQDNDCDGDPVASGCADTSWAQYEGDWGNEDACHFIPPWSAWGSVSYTSSTPDGSSVYTGTDIVAWQGGAASYRLYGAETYLYTDVDVTIDVASWVSDDGGVLWLDGYPLVASDDPSTCASADSRSFTFELPAGAHHLRALTYNEPGTVHMTWDAVLSDYGIVVDSEGLY